MGHAAWRTGRLSRSCHPRSRVLVLRSPRPWGSLLLLLILGVFTACWEAPVSPDVSDEDVSLPPCDPADPLVPFFVDVLRPNASLEDRSEIRLSGLATVIREGTSTDVEGLYAREVQLRFYEDPRDVVVRYVTFLNRISGEDNGFVAVTGESVNAVIWREAAPPGAAAVYVAIRGMDGVSRGFLCRGERCEAPAGLCAPGFDCPSLSLQEPDCAPLDGHACGPQLWPPVGIGSTGAAPDLLLRQGGYARAEAGGSTWTFFVAYASTWPEAGDRCVDAPLAQVAGGILRRLP